MSQLSRMDVTSKDSTIERGSHREGLDAAGGQRTGLPRTLAHPEPGARASRIGAVEWPTLVVAGIIYCAWMALTLWHELLPWWLLLLAGGLTAGWHASFQHEATHGHPTRSGAINATLAGPSLLIWLPFGVFRRDHLLHHANGRLTDPVDDPESFYVLERDWRTMNGLRRGLLLVNNTLAGRLLLGPAIAVAAFLWREAGMLARADFRHAGDWAWHVIAQAPVVGWLVLVADMPLWLYGACFVYPGTALLLLRSFHEHRPAFDLEHRTVIVEAGPIFSLLFLNNNLHAVHHGRPDLPWYKIPDAYRRDQARVLANNDGFYFSGYLDLARRYLFWPKDHPIHPIRRG